MALRELLAFFGIEVDAKALEEGDKAVGGFVKTLGTAAQAIAGAFIVKDVIEFANSTAEAIHQVEATSLALGISTQAVQTWGFMAAAAGEDAGALLNSMGRLQVSAANATDATQGTGKAFAALGVKTHDANGRIKDADALMADVADGIAKVKDPAKQAGYAVALFGRQGRALLPILKGGSKGIREMGLEFEALGGGYSEAAIEATKEYEAATARAAVATTTMRGKIAVVLLPVLTKLVRMFTTAAVAVVNFISTTTGIQSALAAIGVVLGILAVQMALAFAPLLLAAAGVAALYLLFDDLFALFTGKQSLIGEMIDEVFGKGQSADLVKSLRDAWHDIEGAITTAWGAAQKFFGLMDEKLKKSATAEPKQGHWTMKLTSWFPEFQEDDPKAAATENVRRGEAMNFVRGTGSGTARIPGQTVDQATAERDRIVQQVHQEDEKKRGVTGNFVERPIGPTVGQSGGVGDIYFHQPLSVNVTAPVDADQGDLAQIVARAVQDATDESNRALLQTIEQAAAK